MVIFARQGSAFGAPIQEAGFVRIGGLEQWVTIRGVNATHPILLVIHGGPGDSQAHLVSEYTPYESKFVVAQWDQRGAGRTFERNRETVKELTLDRMTLDGIEVADYLRTHLHHRKVIVLGHSWGSYLATEMVKRRPDLFAAYVGTGQVSNWPAIVTEQWNYLERAARTADDQATLDLMKKIGEPDPLNPVQYGAWRRLLNQKYLGPADSSWLKRLRRQTFGLTPDELKAFGEGQSFSGIQLFKVYSAEDLGTTAKEIPVPFFVIQGTEDFFTPATLAVKYFNDVKAPKKGLSMIEGAGHFALVTHQEQFLAALLKAR